MSEYGESPVKQNNKEESLLNNSNLTLTDHIVKAVYPSNTSVDILLVSSKLQRKPDNVVPRIFQLIKVTPFDLLTYGITHYLISVQRIA